MQLVFLCYLFVGEHNVEYWIMDQSEDLGITWVLITCHGPGATADAWTTSINVGLGFVELTSSLHEG